VDTSVKNAATVYMYPSWSKCLLHEFVSKTKSCQYYKHDIKSIRIQAPRQTVQTTETNCKLDTQHKALEMLTCWKAGFHMEQFLSINSHWKMNDFFTVYVQFQLGTSIRCCTLLLQKTSISRLSPTVGQ